MRPSRNYLEDLLTQFALDTIDAAGAARFGSPVYADEMTGKKQETRRSILTAWDEQEATIRELSDLLNAFLVFRPGDRIPEGSGAIFDATREAVKRARGAS